ncbi:Hsp20 family protein [Luteolibacter sp. GHJ8]|uniref:Hsp20 family protein n=1 Tax=Luteolibacter rhizosphaerae TaxID=2989719 RepID=A0ABT3FZG4_9BACT|nr:Hsp20 family protein [Luteolibacter rhizosphaerae]MCW1912982.1 Hsp20 family protein [Luteolibacter rhizosphaerae]
MKNLSHLKRSTRLFAGAITAAGCSLLLAAPFLAAEESKDQSFLQKVQDWQNDMSTRFRDTWRNLRKEGTPSVVSASIDLREQQENYMLRLDLPGRDLERVEVSLKGNVLHILVPEEGNLGRYEQNVELAGAKPGVEPLIDRRKNDGIITVTVAKGKQALSPLSRGVVPDIALLAPSKWESDVLRKMEDLQREMDEIFQSGFGKVPRAPELSLYFDQPRFGSFIDLKEDGSNYVVTAYLPQRDVKNVKATLEGRILKIEAAAENSPTKSGDDGKTSVTRRAYYSQHLTLPGEVKADQLNVETKEGLLKIVVPKAG